MSNDNKDRIIRRIKKCLALSESDNEHEATNALRQAHRLMERHGIDIEETRQPEYEVLDKSDGKKARSNFTKPEMTLFTIVGELFGCSVYTSDGWPVYIGIAPAPEIAEYAATSLLRQLRQNRQEAFKELEAQIEAQMGCKVSGSGKREFNRSYGMTWVLAVHKQVQAFAQSITDSTKAQHEAALWKHLGIQGEVKHRSNGRSRNQTFVGRYAEQQGALDGKHAKLSHGVNEGPTQARIA
jgi:hypothetical protein